METGEQKTLSYRLSITIFPNWENIYKKVCNLEGEEFNVHLQEKLNTQKEGSDLFGSTISFGEYYDSASGLITKFQRTTFKNGKVVFSDIFEFGTSGYIFESDKDSSITVDDFTINFGHTLGLGGYANEDSLFIFPTTPIFNFLMILQQKFNDPNLEYLPIVKFPDGIEKMLKEKEIKNHNDGFSNKDYKNYSGLEIDTDFFEKMGRPIISDYWGGHQYFSSENVKHYSIKLKTFKSGNNERTMSDFILEKWFKLGI